MTSWMNNFNDKIIELRKKRDELDDLLSDRKKLDWYPELIDSIIDCMEDFREIRTMDFFFEKKLKEIEDK